MGLQRLKYAAFDFFTPESLKQVYRQYGREIANAESLTRLVMAPYLLKTSANGDKGVIPGSVRTLKMILDGLDGYTAKQDLEFETATPTVNSAPEMVRKAAEIAISDATGNDKISEIITLLRDSNGSVIDPQFDKAAQLSDQFGGYLNEDVSGTYLLSNMARIAWIDFGVRPAYEKIGVKSSSTFVSQMKTFAQDSMQTLEAFGYLDRRPAVRRVLSAAGVGMTLWSAADIMASSERLFLSESGFGTDDFGYGQQLMNATGRTLHYLAGRPIPQTPIVSISG